eukprot:ANDGO_08197.mRNA.1 hypothetical protein
MDAYQKFPESGSQACIVYHDQSIAPLPSPATRSTWDFDPQRLPLTSAKERMVHAREWVRRGPHIMLAIGVSNMVSVITAGAEGAESLAIAHGTWCALLIVLGCYTFFTGKRKRIVMLTNERLVFREMSAYWGLNPKHDSETTLRIRDVSAVDVASRWINFLLVIALLYLMAGFFTFTSLGNAATMNSLVYGILFLVAYILIVFRFPSYNVVVSTTLGSAWDYSIKVPFRSADDAFAFADMVKALQEELCCHPTLVDFLHPVSKTTAVTGNHSLPQVMSTL